MTLRESDGPFSLLPDFRRVKDLSPDCYEEHFPKLTPNVVKKIAKSFNNHLIVGSVVREGALSMNEPNRNHRKYREFMLHHNNGPFRSDFDVITDSMEGMQLSRTCPRAKHLKTTWMDIKTDFLHYETGIHDRLIWWERFGIGFLPDSLCARALENGHLLLFDPYNVFSNTHEFVLPNLNALSEEIHGPYRVINAGVLACFHLVEKPIPDYLTRELRTIGRRFEELDLPQAQSIWEKFYKMHYLPCANEDLAFLSNLLTTGLLGWVALSALLVYEENPRNTHPLEIMNYYLRKIIEHSDQKNIDQHLARIYPGPGADFGKIDPKLTRYALMRMMDLNTELLTKPEDMGQLLSKNRVNLDYLERLDKQYYEK